MSAGTHTSIAKKVPECDKHKSKALDGWQLDHFPQLSVSIHDVARLLWTLHISFHCITSQHCHMCIGLVEAREQGGGGVAEESRLAVLCCAVLSVILL